MGPFSLKKTSSAEPIPYLFQIANRLFTRCYPLYRFAYYIYKHISERKEILFLRHMLKPGMVVLDIGANVGFYTLIFSKAVGRQGSVHVFEPANRTFEILKQDTKHCRNVFHNNLAVSSTSGEECFAESSIANVDHHLHFQNQESASRNCYTITRVKTTSIDDYCSNLTRLDLIKMDVQGGEAHIIEGMKMTIERFPRVTILMEYWPYGIRRAGKEEKQLLEFFRSNGFGLYTLEGKEFISHFRKDRGYIDLVISKPSNTSTIWN